MIAYTFSKIDSNPNFNLLLTVPSAIVNSLPPSLWFPLRDERGNWKYNTFSAVEDSTMLRWHSGTQKRGGRMKQRDQIDNEARLSWKSIVKTKHQSLTSLAFFWLVPGRQPSGPPYLHSVYSLGNCCFSSDEEFSSTKNKQMEVGKAMRSSSKQKKSIKLWVIPEVTSFVTNLSLRSQLHWAWPRQEI